MDDLRYGTRNRRGDWTPSEPIGLAPVFTLPPRPLAFLKWLPHYFFPWNLLFALSAVAWWAWIVPPVETMRTLSWGWPLWLLAVNCVAVFLFYGAFELQLYGLKRQGRRFKYHGKFPSEQRSKAFWFQSQNLDNVLRTFLSGVTIWTLVEVLVLWAFANGWVPWLSFAQHPLYLAALALAVPVIHEFHFYCIHRLIHVPVLYKWVHSVHHRSVNASPWSSLSMHPVEHLLYFSGVLFHWVIPSHPLHAIFHLQHAGLTPAQGHLGFDEIELGGTARAQNHNFIHYLHHKYFTVNYGGDGSIPFDRWFGSFHDGSAEADARMKSRRQK